MTIGIDEGDSVIIRFTVYLEDESYTFHSISFYDVTYLSSDIYQIEQVDHYLYIDILLENVTFDQSVYLVYDFQYVTIEGVEDTKRVYQEDATYRAICLFNGDLNQLTQQKREFETLFLFSC